MTVVGRSWAQGGRTRSNSSYRTNSGKAAACTSATFKGRSHSESAGAHLPDLPYRDCAGRAATRTGYCRDGNRRPSADCGIFLVRDTPRSQNEAPLALCDASRVRCAFCTAVVTRVWLPLPRPRWESRPTGFWRDVVAAETRPGYPSGEHTPGDQRRAQRFQAAR